MIGGDGGGAPAHNCVMAITVFAGRCASAETRASGATIPIPMTHEAGPAGSCYRTYERLSAIRFLKVTL